MQHLVKMQKIHLKLSKQADAFRIQQQVSEHYRQDVLPLLEKVFNELSNEQEVVRIEQLEIDLGVLSEKEISQTPWNHDILAAIKKQVYKTITGKEENNFTVLETTTINICRQWLSYMQNGWLPWNVLHINEAWYNKVLEALTVDFAGVDELKMAITKNTNVSRRIVLQHDENFLTKLLEILTTENQRELASLISAAAQLFLLPVGGQLAMDGVGREEWKQKIWEQVLQLAASQRGKAGSEQLAEHILMQNLGYQAVANIIETVHIAPFDMLLPVFKKLYEKLELFSEIKPAILNKPKEKVSTELKPDNGVDEEGIFVQHAGIVLIHPFLSSLFKHLQLVEEGNFTGTQSRQKAIGLLHYIATGTASAQEYELVIPKMLCEWPLQMPVEKDMEINEDALDEADNMLQAAIEQWGILKNTSVEGLRESFLQRRGKLYIKNDVLRLQVETSSIDILLDQLPWSVSMIKLPWMKKILRVEWR